MAKRNETELRSLMESRMQLGKNLSFGATEAYKLLRTNLGFCFPNQVGCSVIGVTSSLKGEGKSTTSINLAYTMAQTGKRVLLLEADLRLPTIKERLNLKSNQGLTNLFVGQCTGNESIQSSGLHKNLWVITAGDIPPNPTEILSAAPMQETIEALKDIFDVIVVDLPPVTVVTDAAIVSKYIDGIVMVVRQNYCDNRSLTEAVLQLRFAEARILGFVMTDSDVQKKNYKRYGNKYGYYK